MNPPLGQQHDFLTEQRIDRRALLKRTAAAAAAGRVLACSGRVAAAGQTREVPWLAEVQQPPEKLPEDARRLPPLLVDAQGRPITTKEGWAQRREELLRLWEQTLGRLTIERPSTRLQVLQEDRPPGCVRQLVRYQSEPGLPVEGYLLKPEKVDKPARGVVVLHSTVPHTIGQPAGVEGKPEKAFGLKLARRGVVAFCPRCFLWQGPGEFRQKVEQFRRRHPGSLGMAKMLWDATRAVDVLADLPEVDRQRIGAVGHSLGAKETVYLAAFDPRVKAAVASEGGIGLDFSNWHDVWYLGPGIREEEFQRRHHELLALIAPRAILLVGGESADGDRSWPYVGAVLPIYDLLGQPARVGLYNHRQGHSVPPRAERRIEQWLLTYL